MTSGYSGYGIKLDEPVKSQFFRLLSFRRTPESSDFNMFWMPDQVRHDDSRTFYETVKVQGSGFDKR